MSGFTLLHMLMPLPLAPLHNCAPHACLPPCPPLAAADTKVNMTYVSTSTGTKGKGVASEAVEVGTRIVVQKAATDPISKQRINQIRTMVLPKVVTLVRSALAKYGKGPIIGPRNVSNGTKVIRVK